MANTNLFKKNNNEKSCEFEHGIIRDRRFLGVIIFLLFIALFVSIILAVVFGPVYIKPSEVLRIVIYNTIKIPIGDIDSLTSGVNYDIIWGIRFPRIILGAVVGMGLAIVGVVMQAMVQNPLANPYTLGISSGASLGATFAIMIGVGRLFGTNAVGISAFLGAFICSLSVYVLSNIGGRSSSVKLLLAGMATSAICSAFTSFIIFIANDAHGMRTLTFWLMGSLTSASWDNIIMPSIIILFGVFFFVFQFRNLNMMLMGDENAITLGTDLNIYRKIYMVITSLMTGMIVCVAGTIGFVGLIIPHIVRGLAGSDHRKLVPISSLVGAIFLIWTDVFAKSIMGGAEMPIGVITSLLGAPFFVWLMIKKSYGFGGN
ncbi:FecCD family ABC transporter permease [Paramaledivibacter caminithermalis]|uniref:Iron complex transport system permease protein n=1 Tax=Paramaledivibacter caminithermalis (strain DSM 15212 / CIP 107654 / DViRD3) TaxID=1121301 RepID=A0A1M6P376_PARC5|nr:iron ABC transporter permease [Paramaledivibacter caminithermalis]SHK02353.1 iron complex transport system permease protein [Paramaledivibacter caminithermalis DSM 15212]